MKKINNTNKSNLIKKLFVRLCRLIGFEIIDQSNLNLPVSNRSTTDNLGHLGKNIISIPLGETKISRAVKSLDIIVKTCTSVNLVTQSKKRIFEKDKSEYTFRTINSLVRSLKFGEKFLKNIKIRFHVIDHNSKDGDLEKIRNILNSANIPFSCNSIAVSSAVWPPTVGKITIVCKSPVTLGTLVNFLVFFFLNVH